MFIFYKSLFAYFLLFFAFVFPPNDGASAEIVNDSTVRMINGIAVPGDFPEIITRHYEGETAPGKIFFGSTFTNASTGNYLVICDDDGTPYYYRKFDKKGDGRGSGEFQLQPTGVLTAYLFDPEIYIAFDSTFTIVDTFRCGNGYATDAHELTLLPNGHALLIAKEYRTVDMSQLVQGGDPNASVLGNHVQELDENKNVVFEWLCWDHLNIQDAVHENLRGRSIDYVHMNSVHPDYDGNIIISSRHLSEITKINRETGEIMWRLGGLYNQFEFINDPIRFSYQHYARPVPGKPNSYTLFDNGNHRNPRFSRAVEYKLDLENMTAEKTWEFRYTPDRYISMLGSVQRFSNNNTMINWSTWPPLFANEVDHDGNILFEIQGQGASSNRVRRYEWDGVAEKPYVLAEARDDGVVLIFNKFGDPHVEHYIVYGGTSIKNLVPMDTTSNTWLHITDLQNNSTYYFKVCAMDSNGTQSPFSDTIEFYVNIQRPGENMLANGDFSTSDNRWTFLSRDEASARGEIVDGVFNVDIAQGGDQLWKVQLVQENLSLLQGKNYRFEFDAWADANRVVEAKVAEVGSDWTNYSKTAPIEFKRSRQRFVFDFVMTDPSDQRARVVFNCGLSEINCYIDNVSLVLLESTQIDQPDHSMPLKIELMQNYPNPFNASTTVEYELSQKSDVQLKVFNILGGLIQTWSWRGQAPGFHRQLISASTWNSGVYIYELSAKNVNTRDVQTQRKKMILIK